MDRDVDPPIVGIGASALLMLYPDSAEIRKTPLPIAVEAILLHP